MEILGVKEDEIELSLGLSIGGGSFRKFEKKSSLSSSSITFDSKIFDSRREIEASSCYDEDDGLDLDKRKHEIHKMRRQEGQKKREIENEEEGFEQICKKLKVEDEKTLNQNPNNLGHSSLAFPMIPMQYRFHEPMQYVPFGNGFTFPYHQMMPCWIPPTSTTSSAAKNDDDKNVVQPIACKPFRPFQLSNSDLNYNLPVENCESDHSVSKFGGVKDTDSSRSCGNSSSAGSDYRSSGSHHGSEIRSRTNHSPPPSDQLHMQDSVMSNVQVQSAHSISPDRLKSPLVIKEANTNFDKVLSSNTLQSNPSKTEEEPTFTTNPLPIINKPISNTDFPPHFLPALQQLKGPNVDNYQPLNPRPPRESKGANNEDSNDKLSPLPLSPHQMKVADEEETNQIKKPNEKMNQLSPKSQPQTQPPQIQSLPKMPYVSTIGNGPNGKTITGFLYRYTKTEVSIICVCHGNSFSPAEFVKHAGGTDVSHPLRHIVVVPSAFN